MMRYGYLVACGMAQKRSGVSIKLEACDATVSDLQRVMVGEIVWPLDTDY